MQNYLNLNKCRGLDVCWTTVAGNGVMIVLAGIAFLFTLAIRLNVSINSSCFPLTLRYRTDSGTNLKKNTRKA